MTQVASYLRLVEAHRASTRVWLAVIIAAVGGALSPCAEN